jgi:hypothetical protein
MTTQQKFTAAMQRIADERDLDPLVNFQTGYSSFNGGAGEGPLGRSPSGGPWSYVEGADHDLLVDRIATLLDRLI